MEVHALSSGKMLATLARRVDDAALGDTTLTVMLGVGAAAGKNAEAFLRYLRPTDDQAIDKMIGELEQSLLNVAINALVAFEWITGCRAQSVGALIAHLTFEVIRQEQANADGETQA